MTQKKILIAAGTFTMAIISIFAVNANKKRTSVNSLYYQDQFGNCATISNGTSVFTTVASADKILFRTAGGATNITVYSGKTNSTTCNTPVTVKLK